MPKKIVVYAKVDGVRKQKLFECCLNTHGACPKCSGCSACTADVQHRDGSVTRCRRKTCQDSELCSSHLKSKYHVVIAKSTIPNGGMGLFAGGRKKHRSSRKQAIPVFRKGDLITPYGGHDLKQKVFDSLYDFDSEGKHYETAGPYAIGSTKKGHVTDGMCLRRAGAFCNDYHGSKAAGPNAELGDNAMVEALRDIYQGEEILVDYGKAYWKGQENLDVVQEDVRIDHSVPETGKRGRYIRGGKDVV